MATGKSRIGSLTAVALGWKYYDIDKIIEQESGRTVSEIFAENGEEHFRSLELETLKRISGENPVVVSLGGGTLTQPAALEIVKATGVLVALWASPEVILARVNRKKNKRPLLADLDEAQKKAKIESLLRDRQPIYDQADFRFESTEAYPHHILTRRIIHALQVARLEPLRVELGDRGYPIYIEESLGNHVDSILEKIGCRGDFLLITDQNLREKQKLLLDQIRSSLRGCKVFYFRPGEEEKNIKSLNRLYTYLLRYNYGRKTTLVSVSGGVVGDMVGFAAATYMRGVDFVQVPTTLLSMVDSSVGGKTGINHPLGKNMIGAFYQPRAVIINLAALKTLPPQEFLAGLAEVVKYAVIWDADFFAYLESHRKDLANRDTAVLQYVVRRCCAIKAEVVGRDEKENDLRAILNYGHTFGHALELLSGYRLSHGLAVALGMRCAARLAVALEILSPSEETRQNALLTDLGLPETFAFKLDAAKAWEAMGRDKKAEKGKRVFILPESIGAARIVADVAREPALAALECIGKSAQAREAGTERA